MKLRGNVKLYGVAGLAVRPAQARVRKSLFDTVRGELFGATVLDMFAGTGSLGIEALLQGAERCIFIEMDRGCASALKGNLARLHLDNQAEVIRLDALRMVPVLASRGERFSLVFVAPPYKVFDNQRGLRNIQRMLGMLWSMRVLTDEAAVVVEHRAGQLDCLEFDGLELVKRHEYGQTHLTFFRQRGDEARISLV
jgi:16S rRNA (guanine966-N2)-methyltransferase